MFISIKNQVYETTRLYHDIPCIGDISFFNGMANVVGSISDIDWISDYPLLNMSEPPSMDNPPLINGDYLLNVGDSFVFNGDYCTVTKVGDKSFSYLKQGFNTVCIMTWKFYRTTPSFKSKTK